MKSQKLFLPLINLRQTIKKFLKKHIFHPLGIFHDIDTSLLFLMQKHFYIAQENIRAFCFILLQKGFGTFQEPFLKAFFLFFIIFSCHFFIYRKKI